MQFTDFTDHLTNVTDELTTAYFHRIDTDWQDLNHEIYPGSVIYDIMLHEINDAHPSEDDIDTFNVNSKTELKQLVKNFLAHQTIYQIDDKLTSQIMEYFKTLHLDYEGLTQNRSVTIELDYFNIQPVIYFLSSNLTELPYTLNRAVFFGYASQTDMLDNFLQLN